MRYNRILTMASAAAGGLLVAACGNDVEALSKPDFIAQANAICEASSAEVDPLIEAVYADFDEEFDPTEATEDLYVRWAEAMAEIGPIFDLQLDDVRALEPPAQDKDLIETLIDDQEAALTEFTRVVDAAAAGDEAARVRMDEQDLFANVNQRAREYGLTVCGDED